MAKSFYASDEDVALRAPADFALLCPRDQKIAAGLDGSFAAADLWTLRSSSRNFAAMGVAPGHVVQILNPAPQFKPPGESFAVESVSGTSVTLRRKGQEAGKGQPPVLSGGLSAVEFLILTLDPQIERACVEFDRRFGLSADGSDSLLDPRDVREAIVLSVLHGQYLAMSRNLGGENGDTFASKALAMKVELDELLARLVVQTRSGDGSSSRFSTRLTR